MNWNFKIYFIPNDTVMSPQRHTSRIWWSAHSQQKGCRSIPEALQTQLSIGANSACGQQAADGVNHAIKWKIDLLCCHRDKLQYSPPTGPPEETVRGIFNTFAVTTRGHINSYCAFTASGINKIIKLMFLFTTCPTSQTLDFFLNH